MMDVLAARGGTKIRRVTAGDVEACHDVMWASVTDFGARNGTPLPGTAEEWWEFDQSLQRYLAEQAAEWWVAEDGEGSAVVGYARSIEREGLFELTEFFVLPGHQSKGVGRALIERAFPTGRGEVRSIIATTDSRAMARYYAAGTAGRFPLLTLVGEPREAPPAGDLTPRPLDAASEADVSAMRTIERSVLESARGDAEVRWLLDDREGHLYERDGGVIGFALVGAGGAGPIAAMDPADLPGILLHVEERALDLGLRRLDLQVPGPNEVAARHLLGRGFRIDPWVNLLMSNRPFGRFDRVLTFGPPVFL